MPKILNLIEIAKGLPGLTAAYGRHLLETCVVTLSRHQHKSGVVLQLIKPKGFDFTLNWTLALSEQLDRTYKDQKRATEQAAECLSVLLALRLTKHTVVERSVQKTGCDYWLGNKNDPLFQRKARLEISGIFQGDKKSVESRFKQKAEQTAQSDSSNLPAYVSIIEFSQPMAKFDSK